jgi:hypothetical protein
MVRSQPRAILDKDMDPLDDGNWDDDMEEEDMPGFQNGPEAQIGGVVDMEDDVYLEFEEEAEEPVKPNEKKTWKLLARYAANFKPNAHAMFKKFSEEVWQLRTGIRYSERGKNYYMVTLFSQGDYDFVMRGGPWIFKRNALILKDFDTKACPSEHVIDSVPVWIRIYDVPGEKQNKKWGMRYGNGLGRAMEVDEPSGDQDMHEFLRVRVAIPYNRRLQTQLTEGVKGKPGAVKTYKLKYERVPYFCAHCGFMGHHKEACEKLRRGVPSLDYEAYELRCSPYKKFEYRAHFVPGQGQAAAKRGLSFASFGSAESRKSGRLSREQRRHHQQHDPLQEQAGSRAELEDMPPLEDIVPGDFLQPIGVDDDFDEEEKAVEEDVEQNLLAKIDPMQVDGRVQEASLVCAGGQSGELKGKDAEPIIQFPEDDIVASGNDRQNHANLFINPNILAHMQQLSGGSRGGPGGPTASDMIPALRGLSDLHVSFGSATDIPMVPADTILGKRSAIEEEEVQGNRLELSLGLDYGGGRLNDHHKKGKQQQSPGGRGSRPRRGGRGGTQKMVATGHVSSGKKARPNVWSRQEQ